MQLWRKRVWSFKFSALLATAVFGLLVVAYCCLEFLYAKHYFTIHWMWYEFTFPWNWLSFAFLHRFPEPESTLLVAGLTGVGGATVWWSMSRLAYPTGVLSSLAASLISAYVASLMAWASVLSELLVIQVSQACVLIAFFTLVPGQSATSAVGANAGSNRRGPRFTLWDLLNLIALSSVLLIVSRPALTNAFGQFNLWLPILGASSGFVTIPFLLSYRASLLTRIVYLVLCVPVAVAVGYGLASAFPKLRILWSFYTGAYAFGTFRYFTPAYMVWFAATGLVSVATMSFIQAATRYMLRFQRVPGPLARDGWTTTDSREANTSSQ